MDTHDIIQIYSTTIPLVYDRYDYGSGILKYYIGDRHYRAIGVPNKAVQYFRDLINNQGRKYDAHKFIQDNFKVERINSDSDDVATDEEFQKHISTLENL
jgi:hypothetical protein